MVYEVGFRLALSFAVLHARVWTERHTQAGHILRDRQTVHAFAPIRPPDYSLLSQGGAS